MPKKHCLFFHYSAREKCRVKFLFAFVRHPVDYYVSVWRYLQYSYDANHMGVLCSRKRWDWHPFAIPASLYHREFGVWAQRMLEKQPAWASQLFSLYVGPPGAEYCEFIGRTEYLARDLADVLTYLGYDVSRESLFQLGKINETYVPLPIVSQDLRDAICRSECSLVDRFYGRKTVNERWYLRGD